jgi:ketosteroid isomerase-like protein
MKSTATKGLLTEDFVFAIPYAPEWIPARVEGLENALGLLERAVAELLETPFILDLRLDTLATNPDHVFAKYKSDTRSKITKQPYRNTYVAEFILRDGKIAIFTEYFSAIVIIRGHGREGRASCGYEILAAFFKSPTSIIGAWCL